MKIKVIYVVAAFAIAILPSCNTLALQDLNEDPNRIDYVIPSYLFTSIEINSPIQNGSLNGGMQYNARYKDVPDIGGKQFDYITGLNFDVYSGTGTNGQLNRIQQCLDALKSADDINKVAVCKIMRVLAFQPLTDALGDIPYSEASQGLTGNYKPKYDTQQDIYNGLLGELEDAIASFDTSKPTFGAADVFYGGDIARWKKFANTLMLRMAMHLSNKDAATAKTWALKAINGGLMTDIADIAYLKYSSTATNPRAPYTEYQATQDPDNAQGGKIASTFINQMKNTKDPRMYVLSVVWNKVGSAYVPDTIMAHQKGMIPGSVIGYPIDFESYSEFSPLWWNRDTSPLIILGPSEAYLLLSEAILRGYYTGTTADEKAAYDLGVTRAMQQWALWPKIALSPNTNTVTANQITRYLADGYPYNTAGTFAQRLEQISIQKWVCLFGDDYEVWTNWRRTGYPAFSWKNWNGNQPYPGSVTGGEFFRRMPLPDETASNNENQQEALARQGFPLDPKVKAQSDALLDRVWWDKP